MPFAPMYSRAQNLPLTAQRRGSLVRLRIVVSGVVHWTFLCAEQLRRDFELSILHCTLLVTVL